MGGTLPICPFCNRRLSGSVGLKDHMKAKHPDKFDRWILDGRQPYWRYNKNGQLIEELN